MAVLADVARRFDPDGIMNPGVLLGDASMTRADGADHVLALDVGTQSVRALVFDPSGRLVASARIPIEPYVSPQPGWAEQDAELYWRSIGEACAALWAGGVIAAARRSPGSR